MRRLPAESRDLQRVFFCPLSTVIITIMRPHDKHKIKWNNFPDTYRQVPGVYLINDFYVGASKHIRKRIIQHMNNSMCAFDCPHVSLPVHCAISEAIKADGYITVTKLSDNPFDEKYFYDKIMPVANCRRYDGNGARAKFYHEVYQVPLSPHGKPCRSGKPACRVPAYRGRGNAASSAPERG